MKAALKVFVVTSILLSLGSCHVDYRNENSGDRFCFSGPLTSKKCQVIPDE